MSSAEVEINGLYDRCGEELLRMSGWFGPGVELTLIAREPGVPGRGVVVSFDPAFKSIAAFVRAGCPELQHNPAPARGLTEVDYPLEGL